jgi:hypothetical protein
MTEDKERGGLGKIARGVAMFCVGLVVFAVLVFGVCVIAVS